MVYRPPSHVTSSESVTDALKHPWVDARAAPLYVWSPPAAPTLEDLDEALVTIRAWMPSLDEKYGWINDPSRMTIGVLASHRKVLADHLERVRPYAVRWCAGMATVSPNPAIRGAGTAIGWLAPYPFDVRWCATLEEAWTWVREQLLAHDIVVPTHPPHDLRGAG